MTNKKYTIKFPSAITEIDLRIIFDSNFEFPKGLLVTVECFDSNMQSIKPQTLNWSYSKSLDMAFEYISSTDENKTAQPKQLISKRPIKHICCEIRPWALSDKKVEATDIAYKATVNRAKNFYTFGKLTIGTGV